VLETFFAVAFFSPVLVFEGLFTPEPREDEVDDLFRNMQIDGNLPSGWRRDAKVHMTFQGVLEASAAQDLSLREDGDLRFREVLIGGGEAQTQVNGAWLSLGLWGLLGLGAAGLRRRTEH
jgi:MYXO-CTERM domain-containing protein